MRTTDRHSAIIIQGGWGVRGVTPLIFCFWPPSIFFQVLLNKPVTNITRDPPRVIDLANLWILQAQVNQASDSHAQTVATYQHLMDRVWDGYSGGGQLKVLNFVEELSRLPQLPKDTPKSEHWCYRILPYMYMYIMLVILANETFERESNLLGQWQVLLSIRNLDLDGMLLLSLHLFSLHFSLLFLLLWWSREPIIQLTTSCPKSRQLSFSSGLRYYFSFLFSDQVIIL